MSEIVPVLPSALAGVVESDAPNPVTVYLENLAPRSRVTMRRALCAVASLVREGVEPEAVPWAEMRYVHVMRLRAGVAEMRNRHGEPLAPNTANRYLAALRGVLLVAMRLGLMPAEEYTRAATMEPFRGSRERKGRALDASEVQAVMAAAGGGLRGERDRAILACLFGGGLRRAEVVGLTADRWDGQRLRVLGKGDKERMVPLPEDAAAILRAWMRTRGDGPGPLFGRIRNGVMSATALSEQAISDLARKSGAAAGAAWSPHDARRTRITRLFAQGTPAPVVQRLAGHAKAETTLGYDRSGAEAAERAALAVGMG